MTGTAGASTAGIAPLLLRLLLLEQRAVDPAPFLDPDRAAGTFAGMPEPERALVTAAAALAAGEPKRAIRVLDAASLAGVAAALRWAALTLDRNWSPGGIGAVFTEDDLASFANQEPILTAPGSYSGRSRLFTTVRFTSSSVRPSVSRDLGGSGRTRAEARPSHHRPRP